MTLFPGTKCSVPISTLRLSPFNLGDDHYIHCRIIAVNELGSSRPAYANAVMMPPQTTIPSEPRNVKTVLLSGSTDVRVQWEMPLDLGHTALLGYKVSIRSNRNGFD